MRAHYGGWRPGKRPDEHRHRCVRARRYPDRCIPCSSSARGALIRTSPGRVAQPDTFGAVNTGQTFGGGGPAIPTLVINEIDYDQPDTDTAEFVEILNLSAFAADLTGWTLQLVNGSVDSVYNDIDLSGLSIAPGDYLVVCANAATVPNCDLDAAPDTNFVQNGAPDAVALLLDGVVRDAVSYEGDTIAPYTEGSGTGLRDSGLGYWQHRTLPRRHRHQSEQCGPGVYRDHYTGCGERLS